MQEMKIFRCRICKKGIRFNFVQSDNYLNLSQDEAKGV